MSAQDAWSQTLSVTQVSEILDVSEESVRRWIRENKLAADKKLGRSGHTIYLIHLVDFVNRSSSTYADKFKAWLKQENIPFEIVNASTGISAAAAAAGAASLVFGPVGTIAAGAVGLMLGASSGKIVLKNPQVANMITAEQGESPLCLEPAKEAHTSDAEGDPSAGEEPIESEAKAERVITLDPPIPDPENHHTSFSHALLNTQLQGNISCTIGDNTAVTAELQNILLNSGNSFQALLNAQLRERASRKIEEIDVLQTKHASLKDLLSSRISEVNELQREIQSLEMEIRYYEAQLRIATKEAALFEAELGKFE